MDRHPNTLAERRQAGEDFGRLLSEFLDQFYLALVSGGAQAMIAWSPPPLTMPASMPFWARPANTLPGVGS